MYGYVGEFGEGVGGGFGLGWDCVIFGPGMVWKGGGGWWIGCEM